MIKYFFIVLLWVSAPLWAGTFSVVPVKITLSKQAPIVTLELSNASAVPTVVQATLASWQQHNNFDVYKPTHDLIIVPPLVKIPANGHQLMRIAMARPLIGDMEKDYRVFLRQVLAPRKKNDFSVRVALQLALPIFIKPQKPMPLDIHWQMTNIKRHQINLMAENIGNIHQQLRKITLKQNHRVIYTKALSAVYLLPHSRHHWSFKIKKTLDPHAAVRLVVDSLQGEASFLLSKT